MTQIQQRSRGEKITDRLVSLGDPGENRLLGQTVAELDRLGLTPREVALDGGLCPGRPSRPWPGRPHHEVHLGRAEPGSRRPAGAGPAPAPAARAAAATSNAATGCGATTFEGDHGQRIWTGWAVLAYNLDTLAIHTA